MFLILLLAGLVRMDVLRRRYWKAEAGQEWISPLATALQAAQIIYMVGACFVGIAWQPFMLALIGVQIGFDNYVGGKRRDETKAPWRKSTPVPVQLEA